MDEEMKSHWSRTRLSEVSFVLLLRRAPSGSALYSPILSGHFPAALESLSLVSLKVLSVSLLPEDSQKLLFFISF